MRFFLCQALRAGKKIWISHPNVCRHDNKGQEKQQHFPSQRKLLSTTPPLFLPCESNPYAQAPGGDWGCHIWGEKLFWYVVGYYAALCGSHDSPPWECLSYSPRNECSLKQKTRQNNVIESVIIKTTAVPYHTVSISISTLKLFQCGVSHPSPAENCNGSSLRRTPGRRARDRPRAGPASGHTVEPSVCGRPDSSSCLQRIW